jgi:hypothetical protein
VDLDGERFSMQQHGAHPVNRRLFLKDISRVENFVQKGLADKGFAIFLTNESLYWRQTGRLDTIDFAFRLHEGAVLSGEIAWGDKAGDGTKAGVNKAIALNGTYRLAWQAYSKILAQRNSEFRYLAVEI